MRIIGSLVGFDARMPGVLSFVSPVFMTSELSRAGQVSEEQGGAVHSFRGVPPSPGFMATSSSLCIVTGEPRLYAFQTTEREIVAGNANRLARFLVGGSENATDFLRSHPKTKAAIDRFVAMADGMAEDRRTSSLYVMQRPRVSGRFSLGEVRPSEVAVPAPSTFEAAVGSLRRMVWRGLRDGHGASFGGHVAFGAAVRAHVSAGGVVAQEAAASVANGIVADHRRWRDVSDKKIGAFCKWCSFSLVCDYPSHEGIQRLVRLIAEILQLSDETRVPYEGDTLDAATGILAKYFLEVLPPEGGDPVRDEFVFLLSRMKNGQLSSERASDVFREMSSDRHGELWIAKGSEATYVGAMEDLNSQFDSIASKAEAVGAHESA